MNFKTIFPVVALFIFNFTIAQNSKQYLYKKVTINTKITNTTNGKLVHYVASKESGLSVETLKQHFLAFDNYTRIFEYTEINKVIKKVNNDEWIVYQQHNPPWPVTNSHVIFLVKLTITSYGFKFTTESTSFEYPLKKYKAMPFINTTYTVKKLANQKTLLKIDSKFSPIGNPPKWIFDFWFPKGPVKILENFEKEFHQ